MTFICVCVCVCGQSTWMQSKNSYRRETPDHIMSKATFTAYNMKLYATNMELNKIKCKMKLE